MRKDTLLLILREEKFVSFKVKESWNYEINLREKLQNMMHHLLNISTLNSLQILYKEIGRGGINATPSASSNPLWTMFDSYCFMLRIDFWNVDKNLDSVKEKSGDKLSFLYWYESSGKCDFFLYPNTLPAGIRNSSRVSTHYFRLVTSF